MTTQQVFRKVALDILGRAFGEKVEAQRRVWQARDEVTRLETLLAGAKSRLTTEQREMDEAQAMLETVWRDALTPERALVTDGAYPEPKEGADGAS